jgi:hypothetical protein
MRAHQFEIRRRHSARVLLRRLLRFALCDSERSIPCPVMHRLDDIPGVAETTLAAEQIADPPADAPPAPWRAQARAISWLARPDHGAGTALSEALPAALGKNIRPLLTIGSMISYDDTPVGPYCEVLAMVVLRRGGSVFTHVPFIAVDSRALAPRQLMWCATNPAPETQLLVRMRLKYRAVSTKLRCS